MISAGTGNKLKSELMMIATNQNFALICNKGDQALFGKSA